MPPPTPRGRGLVIAGSVLMVVAVLGGLIGSVVAARGIDFGDLERDVVVEGPGEVLVPGEIRFRVVEPLGESSGEQGMTVGIAVDGTSAPECAIRDLDGGEADLDRARIGEELIAGRSGFKVRWSARLAPGTYVATCGGEEGERSDFVANFTVGRIIGHDDVSAMLRPMLAMLGVGLGAGVMLFVGVILLVVGLVQRSRSRRLPTYPGYPGPSAGPPGPSYPGPSGYPPSGYPPGSGYAPTGYPPPTVPPAPTQPPTDLPAPTQPPTDLPAPAKPPAPTVPDSGEVDGWTIPPSKR